MRNKPVLLIGFYNTKAMGVRYLERALIESGFKVYSLFLKNFNSTNPKAVTEKELILLKELIHSLEPGLIGLSVMSTLYFETVEKVNALIRNNFDIPIVWGGIYASLFPEKSLKYADFALRGEGEESILELADAVLGRKPYHNILNLAYKNPDGSVVVNKLRPLCNSLDELGYPLFNLDNKFLIEDDHLTHEDPMFRSVSYELSASRGCPFTCSYCSSVNLRRMYGAAKNYVRFRSVSSVIRELEEAVCHMKNLKVIRFWDEIFADDENWVSEFADQYKNKIRLPFEIWTHPLKVKEHTISMLVEAGLYKVVMGIQSGSSYIRREIFHRCETQEDILNAVRVLNSQKVPHIIYDFMLRHPFEKEEDLRQTYELCVKIPGPFELQLHGLSFLPGTDILKIAQRKGIPVLESQRRESAASLKDNYRTHWGRQSSNSMINFWYSLIYISQFNFGRQLSQYFAKASKSDLNVRIATCLPVLFYPYAIIRYYLKKALLLYKAALAKTGRLKPGRNSLQYSEGK